MPITNPVVNKIFDDLDAWREYCRDNAMVFNPDDLYKSDAYKAWQRNKNSPTASRTNYPKRAAVSNTPRKR